VIEIIKYICQATVLNHRSKAIVIGDEKTVVVSNTGSWPVCIDVDKLSTDASKAIYYLGRKLKQAGVLSETV